MAADATKIFGGAAVTIEISAAGADVWTDLGFFKADAEITWEPYAAPLSDQNEVPLSGLGKIKATLVQSEAATLTALETYKTAKADLRITDVMSNVHTVTSIFIKVQVKRAFAPNEPHTVEIMAQRETQNPDDWCAAPS